MVPLALKNTVALVIKYNPDLKSHAYIYTYYMGQALLSSISSRFIITNKLRKITFLYRQSLYSVSKY